MEGILQLPTIDSIVIRDLMEALFSDIPFIKFIHEGRLVKIVFIHIDDVYVIYLTPFVKGFYCDSYIVAWDSETSCAYFIFLC